MLGELGELCGSAELRVDGRRCRRSKTPDGDAGNLPWWGLVVTFKLVPPGRHSFSPALGAILSCPGDLSGEQFNYCVLVKPSLYFYTLFC